MNEPIRLNDEIMEYNFSWSDECKGFLQSLFDDGRNVDYMTLEEVKWVGSKSRDILGDFADEIYTSFKHAGILDFNIRS